MGAVSVRNTLGPSASGLKPWASAILISSSVKPPSGPISSAALWGLVMSRSCFSVRW